MQNRFLRAIAGLACLALFGSGLSLAHADTDDKASAPTHPCAGIASPTERLACYDAAFAGSGANHSLDKAQIIAETPKVRAEREREEFGLTSSQRRAKTPESEQHDPVKRIESTVTSVQYLSDGRRLVDLENGQRWMLTETTARGPLQTGDQILVRNAALGTFMLETPRHIPLRAKRVR